MSAEQRKDVLGMAAGAVDLGLGVASVGAVGTRFSTNIPTSILELMVWGEETSQKVASDPPRFMVTMPQAMTFTDLAATYRLTVTIAGDKATRTTKSVSDRNRAKKNLLDFARMLMGTIASNPNVRDAVKEELGIFPARRPSPLPVPSDTPDLDVRRTGATWVQLRMHSGETNTRRGLPKDVTGAEVYGFSGPVAPEPLNQWKFWGNATRAKVTVDFGSTVPPGGRVWVQVRWYNRRGTGPMSLPAEVRLAGLGAAATAAVPICGRGETLLMAA